jgi:hypothetical protein
MALTRTTWIADANKGLAFIPEVERLLEWADSHRVPVDNDSCAFGIFRAGKKAPALGICEVVISRKSIRSKWVKMLRLHLSPAVDAQLQGGDPDGAMSVFLSSIQGAIGLQSTHQANTLKVFGRTNDQLNFLKVLVTHLQPKLAEHAHNRVKVSIEGRFLCIVVN